MRPETASVMGIAQRIQKSTPRTVAPLLTDAMLFLRDACDNLKIDAQARRLRVNSHIPATPAHIASALVEFALDPTKQTAQACYRVIAAHNAAIIRRSDATPARILNPDVRAPELPKPHIQRCPAGALDWQTQPVIGVNPAVWAEGFEVADAIEARAKRIQGSPRVERAVTASGSSLLRGNYTMQTAKEAKRKARIRAIAQRAMDTKEAGKGALDAAVEALARLWGAGYRAGSGPA